MTTGPTPDQLREQNRRERDRLADQVGKLRQRLSFTDPLETASKARARLPELRQALSEARGRGYLFRQELEAQLADVEGRADALVELARQEGARAGRDLRDDVDRLDEEQRGLSRLDLIAIGPLIDKLEASVRRLDGAFDEADKRIAAITEPLRTRAAEAGKVIDEVVFTLDQFAASTAKLQPEENPVAAVPATWKDAPGGDEVPGRLLLSDHRIRFEQVEEKVTKRKLLFFAAEKEEVRQVVLDEPIGHLLSCTDQQSGVIVKDQLLVMTWDRKGKAPPKTTIELERGTAKDWDELVERLKRGDLERDMVATAPKADVHGVPVQWPEKCTECGANLDAPVKGQTTIGCPYCGATHDVVMGQG